VADFHTEEDTVNTEALIDPPTSDRQSAQIIDADSSGLSLLGLVESR